MTVARTLCVALLVLAVADSVASAHGVLLSSSPLAGSSLDQVPENVAVSFSEAPGPGTAVQVSDGCDRNVASPALSQGAVVDIGIEEAEPGRWKVRFRVVSAVDGHSTRGNFAFKVRGNADCPPGERAEAWTEVQIGSGENTRIAGDAPPDDGGFPVIPFAIGSIVIVAVALLLRYAAG
jgi:methionine-rich copper-binding protein CopC